MSDATPPDDAVPWHELPHNPVAFFGLDEGFDLKDLKRAYNQLIRKYKPENSPAEFQQIRAAYERLDNQLRYGERPQSFSMPSGGDWSQLFSVLQSANLPEENSQKEPAQVRRPAPAKKKHQDYLTQLLNEVRNSTPAAVMETLSQKPDKSAFDYYVMAVLSDTLPGSSNERFVRHILAGLALAPRDPALRGILYSLFRQSMPADEIPPILIRTARAIGNDGFYSMTEPLWDILVRNYPFDKVRQLLEKCESMLKDFRLDGKLAFYLHLLRIGIFRADQDWILQTIAFLEENHSNLNPLAEYELDRLQNAWNYRQSREMSPPTSHFQRRMDAALEQYFTGPEETRETALHECQIQIATSIDDVMTAFPFQNEEEQTSPLLTLWFDVSKETMIGPRRRPNQERLDRRIVWFLSTLQSQTDRSSYGRLWDFVAMLIHSYSAAGIFALLVIAIGRLCLGIFLDSGIAFGIPLVVALIALIPVHLLVIKPYWNTFCRKMALRCYKKLWRREVLQFLGHSQMTAEEFFFKARELRDPKMDYVTWTLNFVRIDDTLQLYANAQMFLR